MLVMHKWCIALLFCAPILDVICSRSFGKYKVYMQITKPCSPLGNNATRGLFTTVQMLNDTSGSQTLQVRLDVTKRMGPVGFKITLLKLVGKKQSLIFNYKLMNVCESKIVREINKGQNHLTDKCSLKLGTSYVTYKDVNGLVHMFLGENFVYGSYIGNTKYYADNVRISCFDMFVNILEKK